MDANNVFKKIFLFNTMVTPKIIACVYWLMLLGAIIGGIYVMYMPFFGGVFKGLLTIVVGAVSARIGCEILIVLFKINDHLRRIADAQASRGAAGQGAVEDKARRPAAPFEAAQ